jgi:hypothetical protein
MKRRIVIVVALALVLLMAGCTTITVGKVTGKESTPAHLEQVSQTRYREEQVYISEERKYVTEDQPYTVYVDAYVPDVYKVSIEGKDKDGKPRQATYKVTEVIYESLQIGDPFDYEKVSIDGVPCGN